MNVAILRGIGTTLTLAMSLGAAGAGLAGCARPAAPHQPGGIALVVGGRSNMPRPVLVRKAREYLKDAILSKDTLFVVGVSGQPKLLYTEDIDNNCDSTVACNAAVDEELGRIQDLLGKVRAEREEADTLGAIEVAAKQLANLDRSGPKRMVVIDSGLQTTGDMPLQTPGALGVDPEEEAKWVSGHRALRDLSGVDVLLTGIGTAFAPQPELSNADVGKLEDLWAATLTAAGARVKVDSTPLDPTPPAGGLPRVTPILPESKPKQSDGGCFVIREDQVGFLPGRSDFRDPASAQEVLAPVARELRAKQITATVIGTTALPEPPPYPLSRQRAQRVVDLLVRLRVARNWLTPVGVGTNFAGFVPDTDAKGELIPALAVQNRLVIVQPAGRTCPG